MLGRWGYVLEGGRFTLTRFSAVPCHLLTNLKPTQPTNYSREARDTRGVCHNGGKSALPLTAGVPVIMMRSQHCILLMGCLSQWWEASPCLIVGVSFIMTEVNTASYWSLLGDMALPDCSGILS